MKNWTIGLMAAMTLAMTGCGTVSQTTTSPATQAKQAQETGVSVWKAVTNKKALGNVFRRVIGQNKLKPQQLLGTWKYSGPGCAFTSKSAWAEAGGDVVAVQIEQKLEAYYAKLGINADNTDMEFDEDGRFSATVNGHRLSGTYEYNPANGELTLKSFVFSLTGYATRTGSGIAVLFESKKLLTLFQMVSSWTGNSTLESASKMTKNFDAVRLGFELTK